MISRKALGMVWKVFGLEHDYAGLGESSVNRIKKCSSSQKNSEKGFTLVELIVVLVILAILAAAVVPGLLGFTDHANKKKHISEAKEALSATESMLSDAYTEGLVYLPRRVREEAFNTSGLKASTEFTINTVKNFKNADGTYNSVASYTVASALFKADDGIYVYYNGSEWRVLDEELTADKDIIAGKTGVKTGENDNYIVVWPWDSEKAVKDSASSSNNIAKNEDEGIDTYIDEEDEETRIEETESADGEEVIDEPSRPGMNYNTVTLTLLGAVDTDKTNVKLINNERTNRTVVKFGNKTAFTTTFTADGSENGTLSDTPNPVVQDKDNLDETSLKWVKSDDSNVIYSSISEIKTYLNENAAVPGFDSVTFVAEVKEKSIEDIPVSFFAYNNGTQSVEVSGGKKDSDNDGVFDTIEAKYGIISHAVVCDVDLSNVNVTQADIDGNDVSGTPKPNEGAITFDNNWVIKDTNESTTGGSIICIKDENDEIIKANSENISEVISNRISALVDTDGDGAIDKDENNIPVVKNEGIVFLAPADINKTLHVRGIINSGNYAGLVSFDDTETVAAENDFSIEESYVKYELDGKIYKDNSKTSPLVFNGEGAYSVFDDNKLVFSNKKLKVKWWNLYKCDKNLTEEALKNETDMTSDGRTREKDIKNVSGNTIDANLSELLIKDKLFGNNEYGELAVVDVAPQTTLLKHDVKGKQSPVRKLIRDVANGKIDYITSINYIPFSIVEKNTTNIFMERCLSTTTVRQQTGENARLLCRDEEGNYLVNDSDRDEKYPAYTVAYSIRKPNNDPQTQSDSAYLYDVYIVTEDDSEIKVQDSCKEMFSNCQRMTVNTMVAKLETTDVTDMSYMFYKCCSITKFDLSNFNTSKVTDMSYLFDNCRSAASINVSSFDTSKVVTMRNMFGNSMIDKQPMYNNVLTKLDLSNFSTQSLLKDASKTRDSNNGIRDMFIRCSALQTIIVDPTQWRVDKFVYMDGNQASDSASGGNTFKGCVSLKGGAGTTPEIVRDVYNDGDINVDQRTFSMTSKYAVADEYPEENYNGDDTAAGEHGYFTAMKAASLVQLNDNWVYNKLGVQKTSITGFSRETTLTREDVLAIDDKISLSTTDSEVPVYMWVNENNELKWWSQATTISLNSNATKMFNGWTSLKSIDLTDFDLSQVTDFSEMFNGCTSLTSARLVIDTSETSNVKMTSMFKGTAVKTVSITGDWSNVTDISYMFSDAHSIQDIDFGERADMSNLQTIAFMFFNLNKSNVDTKFNAFAHAASSWDMGDNPLFNTPELYDNSSEKIKITNNLGWGGKTFTDYNGNQYKIMNNKYVQLQTP
ncbi:prepilin-type N-terminal cleavage/methylation domain-containing protein [Lachnospiraceae bacterium NE2001]|nr:prepilin-type N-terminal cleavage/methylation domain-containing protein [Lachnospiraceae bacterium NE2001]